MKYFSHSCISASAGIESTKGAPTLVGGKTTLQLQVFGYKSPKLGEYAHFFTSMYIKQITLLFYYESPKLEAAMPKRCSAEYVCISQKNKIDTLAPNSDFQTQTVI